MDLINANAPTLFARARLFYALQTYLSENKFRNFVLALDPQDTKNTGGLAHALVGASSKTTRVTLNSSDGELEAYNTGVKSLAQLLGEGYQLVKYTDCPHIFKDMSGNPLLVIIPCPPPLVRAGLNPIFVEDLKEAKASLGNVMCTSDDAEISCARYVCCNSKSCDRLHHFLEGSTTSTILARSEAVKVIKTWQATCLESFQLSCVPPAPAVTGLHVQYDFGPGSAPSMFAATGLRAITSGGDYNFELGGHFVVKEAKIVLQFPPCATILIIPSAITAGQIPVQAHEYKVTLVSCGA
ncbi:hypothetical protein EST38_g14682 [Candolleomyces aberdarensis]|uniref:Uncharacterized protein n=1 Tax=Candolleomyces aberdarensis TaxID=2316362 RepID=A0A4Q2CWR8_9AGAR|nr:hypothetical protein EST38_g14682 [Candolleomyces aberdarensis]